MNKLNHKKGFTLIELLVVISIIGLLSSVVLAGLTSARQKAQAAKVVAEMNQLKTAIEMYRNDKGKYPNEGVSRLYFDQDATDFLTDELVGGSNKYISSIPNPTTHSDEYTNDLYYITGEYNDQMLSLETPDFSFHKACGEKIVKSYLFVFYNNQNLNFPRVGVYEDNSYIQSDYVFSMNTSNNLYCIGE